MIFLLFFDKGKDFFLNRHIQCSSWFIGDQ